MEFIVFIMCLPILIPLWILYVIIMCNYKPKRGKKHYYHDYDYDEYRYSESEDDYEDCHESSIYDRFQNGTCSKSDMELLMEDDDIRDEFYEDY